MIKNLNHKNNLNYYLNHLMSNRGLSQPLNLNNDSNHKIENKEKDSKMGKSELLMELFSIGNLVYISIYSIVIFILFIYSCKNYKFSLAIADYTKTNDNTIIANNIVEISSNSTEPLLKENQTFLLLNGDKVHNLSNITNCKLYTKSNDTRIIYDSVSILIFTNSVPFKIKIPFLNYVMNKYIMCFVGIILNSICKLISLLIKKQYREQDKCSKLIFDIVNIVILYLFLSYSSFELSKLEDLNIDPCIGYKENSLSLYYYKLNNTNDSLINLNFIDVDDGFLAMILEFWNIFYVFSMIGLIVVFLVIYLSLLKRNRDLTQGNRTCCNIGIVQSCMICCFLIIFIIPIMFYSFNGMLFYALKINIIWNSYYANQVKKSLRYLLDLLSITISFIFLIASVISNFIKS